MNTLQAHICTINTPEFGGMQKAKAEPEDASRRRSIVSYTRRSGKLDTRLERAWREYSDDYFLQVNDDTNLLGVQSQLRIDNSYLEASFGRSGPVIAEIGSGQGENIVAAAKNHPECDFIALEVYEPGIAHTMLLAGKMGLTNLKIARTNAPDFIAATAANTLNEVWTFFPDPWPKMKHHKRRLVQVDLAMDVARVLVPSGAWRLATDIDDYALHVHEILDGLLCFKNVGGLRVSLPTEHVGKGTADQASALPHDWFIESERFEGRVLTNFERKGLNAGRQIHDFTYESIPSS